MSSDSLEPHLFLERDDAVDAAMPTALDMTGPQYATSAPAIVHQADSADWVVLVRGADSQLWWTRKPSGGAWTPWAVLGDIGVVTSAPASYVGTDGSWWVAILDAARHVRWNQGNASGWAGWGALPWSDVFDSRPGIAWTQGTGVYLFGRKADCSISWTARAPTTGEFSQWSPVPGGYISGPALLASDPDTVVVGAVGLDNSAFLTSGSSQTAWSAPYGFGGTLTSDPVGVFGPHGSSAGNPVNWLFARGTDGCLWWSGAIVGQPWGPWQPVQELVGVTLAYGPALSLITSGSKSTLGCAIVDTNGTVRVTFA